MHIEQRDHGKNKDIDVIIYKDNQELAEIILKLVKEQYPDADIEGYTKFHIKLFASTY